MPTQLSRRAAALLAARHVTTVGGPVNATDVAAAITEQCGSRPAAEDGVRWATEAGLVENRRGVLHPRSRDRWGRET